MLRVSLRNLLVNKLRLLLTVAAVTVGVTFVSGTFVLSDTMVKAFDELYAGLTSGTDVVVKSQAAYDADIATTGGQVRPLDESMVATVREVPGVAVAEGSVSGFALVLDKHGEPIQPGGAPTIGTSVTADRRLAGAATFREGRTPSGAARDGARRAHREEGRLRSSATRSTSCSRTAARTFTLVGIIGFGETDSLLGATLAGFDLPTAQQVLGKVGVVDEVDVMAADGVQRRRSCATASPRCSPTAWRR